LEIKTKIVSCYSADSKPVKQEVNGTVILPPLVFPGSIHWLGVAWQSSLCWVVWSIWPSLACHAL